MGSIKLLFREVEVLIHFLKKGLEAPKYDNKGLEITKLKGEIRVEQIKHNELYDEKEE